MAEQLPRGSEYPTTTPESVNRRLGANRGDGTNPSANRQNLSPYGTAARDVGSPRLRDVEANTSGRASRTGRLDPPAPAPTEAEFPETSAKSLPTPQPYGFTTGRPGQGGITRV